MTQTEMTFGLVFCKYLICHEGKFRMPRVLSVEDDPLVSKSLKMSLEYQGFDLLHSATCRDARIVAQKEKIDLFILDVNLPINVMRGPTKPT